MDLGENKNNLPTQKQKPIWEASDDSEIASQEIKDHFVYKDKKKKKKARLFQEDMLIHAANTVNHFLYLPP